MSDAKIKVIIKRPDEKAGHVTNISASLKNLQKTVEGYIQTVTVGQDPKVIMICNEEGKIQKLQKNFKMGGEIFFDIIRGDGDHLRRIRRRRRLRRRSDRLRDMEAIPESLGQ